MREHLTQQFVANVKPGPCAYDVADAEKRGLVLRVRPSGKHSWLFRQGRGEWITIGRADEVPPALARKRADILIGHLAEGRDPIAEKRRAKAEKRESRVRAKAEKLAQLRDQTTLRIFIADHFRPWASANRKSGADSASRVEAAFANLLDKRLQNVTAFDLERWRIARHKAGVAPTTTNRDLDALRAVFTYAVTLKLVDEHPMKPVGRTKVDAIGRLRYLSPEEETRLRQALDARERRLQAGRDSFNAWRAARGITPLPPYGTYADHLQPIVLLALLTGARRGELFSLRWADVDLACAAVTFSWKTTKTSKARRVPLCAEAVRVLRAWRDQQPEPARDDDHLVFPSPQTSERLDNITTAWGQIVAKAKLRDFTFHDLRHSFASRLVRAGVDLYVVQRLLGHASPIMTQRYAHLDDDTLVAAVAKIG